MPNYYISTLPSFIFSFQMLHRTQVDLDELRSEKSQKLEELESVSTGVDSLKVTSQSKNSTLTIHAVEFHEKLSYRFLWQQLGNMEWYYWLFKGELLLIFSLTFLYRMFFKLCFCLKDFAKKNSSCFWLLWVLIS